MARDYDVRNDWQADTSFARTRVRPLAELEYAIGKSKVESVRSRLFAALRVRASADYEVFQAAEEDESVIGSIVAAQREKLEREIGELKVEAERIAGEARELAGEVPF